MKLSKRRKHLSLEDQTLIKSTIRKVLESRKEEYLHNRTQRLACLLAWGADKKIMIGKTSTTSVMEINMRDGVIAL